eukprot:757186-Hanusia_phi.AAC.1
MRPPRLRIFCTGSNRAIGACAYSPPLTRSMEPDALVAMDDHCFSMALMVGKHLQQLGMPPAPERRQAAAATDIEPRRRCERPAMTCSHWPLTSHATSRYE